MGDSPKKYIVMPATPSIEDRVALAMADADGHHGNVTGALWDEYKGHARRFLAGQRVLEEIRRGL